MSEGESERGLLVVGHGTRDPVGVREFLMLFEAISRRTPDLPAEPSFLEFARPTIEEGVDRLLQRGAGRLGVLPLMLFAAGHVRRDIPRAVAAAAAKQPGVEIVHLPHLGNARPILELSLRRYQEAVAGRQAVPPEETHLVLVGRGTRDPRATEEMLEFVAARRENTPGIHVSHCSLAMARPSLDEGLSAAAALPARRVVVQPHLLFSGRLLEGLVEAVGSAAVQWGDKDWVLAPPLGPDRLLEETVRAIVAP